MITQENKVSTELVAHMKSMIYNNIIQDFINFSNQEVIRNIDNIINQEMENIKHALLSDHANVVLLREKYKIYENLKKEL